MNRLIKVYAIASLLLFLVLLFSPLKGNFSEWRKIQRRYNKFINGLPQKIKPAPMSLQQIWARDLGRVDRCTTCHLGVQEKKLASAPEPFKSHPKMFHDIGKLGCTICHMGQGAATNYKDAHLAGEFWDKPVLPRQYLESSCGRCHVDATLKETPVLKKGKYLIKDLNCVGCHDIPNMSKVFAPSLDGVGSKILSRNWLLRWLKDPQQIQPKTKMPNFYLSDEDANVLADFLMSFRAFPGNFKLEQLPPVYKEKKEHPDFIDLGKTRFREARCISCHLVEGKGGRLAPDLAKLASKAKDIWIYNYIRHPRQLQPGVEMPQYGFTSEEAAAITAYIESEFIDWDAPEETGEQPTPIPNFYEKGLEIFNRYNCGGCHHLSDAKIVQNRAPDLSTIGSKPIYEIDFASSGIPHVLYNYIQAKIANPRIFGQSARMPKYNLTTNDLNAITTYLLSLKKESLPKQFYPKPVEQVEFNPQGKVGQIFKKYACLKCHKVFGTGETVAPDLSIVGSRLQKEWVRQYFKIPYSLRPLMTERMPNLFISDQEIDTLVNFFYTVLLNDELSKVGTFVFRPEDREQGKGLYWEKYGCQSCHIIGGKGGYVGPPLDNVGNRLKPGWVYSWLLNPQKYLPDTIEPKSGMTKEDALKIVAYLMSL